MRWTILLALLATATATFLPEKDWWETALVYQIYPRSFKDSNGDGIGDLNGITEKLPYLKETGVDAIWLSPIYLSPMYDFGYDITDYRQIAPEYGTMEDFNALMKEAKNLGIRVILDFVPNHTSNQSEWFIKSVRRDPDYENYYVWADGVPDPDNPDKLLPPSNWVSAFRKSAWQYNEQRKQFYLHQFVIGQPDLNYREPKVHQEMKDVCRFWLDKGVSGFRVDAVNFIYEVDPAKFDGKYPDEPLSGIPDTISDDYEYLNHIYTKNQDETYNLIFDWREVLDEYLQKDGEYKLMLTEAYTDLKSTIRYYGNKKRNGSIPFNFSFLEELNNQSNARDIKFVIDKWMTYVPEGKPANWVNGNHDKNRLASRFSSKRVDAMNMLALILPGITVTYQGEELGMTDGYINWKNTKDPQGCNTDDPENYWKKSRDPCRTPFQWDNTPHAGFSNTSGTTWLPVASDYKAINLEAQLSVQKSHYQFYRDVVSIKKGAAVRHGDLETKVLSDDILVVTRLLAGSKGIVAVVNLSDKEKMVDLTKIRLLPSQLEVIASGVNCSLEQGKRILKTDLPITGNCAIVFHSLTSVPNVNI